MKPTVMMIAVLAVGLSAVPAAAQTYQQGPLKIEQPWTRATPKGAAVAGGYLKITNTGSTPDRLVGGSSEASGGFEVHEMKMEQGVMKMRPLPNGLEIKPGQTVELKPGSYHLMFVGLKKPLAKGDKVKGTLTFEKAGTANVEFAVEGIGGSPPGTAPAPGGGHSGH